MPVEERTITSRIWLFLLREGGWWSAADVADEMNGDTRQAKNLLASMAVDGTVRRRDKGEVGESRVTYGITSACKVPHGITIAEMAACGTLRLEP